MLMIGCAGLIQKSSCIRYLNPDKQSTGAVPHGGVSATPIEEHV